MHKANWTGFKQSIGIFEPFASISFGVYITHYFMIVQSTYLDTVIDNPIARYVLYFIVCFVTAYFIERIAYLKISELVFRKKKTDTSLLLL